MSVDELRGDSPARSFVPNLFSRLLEATCGGHALWRPLDSLQRGGEVGDCGYISDGVFWRLCNCYDDPLPGLPRLPRPARNDMDVEDVSNTSSLRSSLSSSVTFSAPLPFSIPLSNIAVRASVSAKDAAFAFLSFAGPHRVETRLSRSETQKLERYLKKHYATLKAHAAGEVFIVCYTIAASGWLSGLSCSHDSDVSADASVSLPGWGEAQIGDSRLVRVHSTGATAVGDGSCLSSDGPVDWTPETPIRYPVVLGGVQLRRRRKGRLFGIGAATRTEDVGVDVSLRRIAGSADTVADGSLSMHRSATSRQHQSSPTDLDVLPPADNGPGDVSGGPGSADGVSPHEEDFGYTGLTNLVLDEFLHRHKTVDIVVCDTGLLKLGLGTLEGMLLRLDNGGFESSGGKQGGLTKDLKKRLRYLWDEERDGDEVVAFITEIGLTYTPSEVECVVMLNNLFHIPPRAIGDLTWSEVLRDRTWTANLAVASVGTFTGVGTTRKAAREAAASKALKHLSLQ